MIRIYHIRCRELPVKANFPSAYENIVKAQAKSRALIKYYAVTRQGKAKQGRAGQSKANRIV